MKRYFWHLICLWVLLARPLAAETVRIYVANKGGNTIDVIDPATNKIVQVIEGLKAPETARFSPQGDRLYIAGAGNALEVVDRKTGQHIKTVPLSGHPNDLAVTRDGRRVLICIADFPGALDIVDTTSLEKVKTIAMKSRQDLVVNSDDPEWMHDIVVTPDGKYAIGGSVQGKFAMVIDLQSEQPAWEIHFERGVRPLAIESGSDGSARRIFLQLLGLNEFVVVDFATRKETTRIKLPDDPFGYNEGKIANHGIEIAPDGKTLWVNSRDANSVFVYSLPKLNLLGHVFLPLRETPGHAPIGAGPYWITFTPDSRKVYICNRVIGSVTAIDATTMKVEAVIPVGKSPDRISTLVLP